MLNNLPINSRFIISLLLLCLTVIAIFTLSEHQRSDISKSKTTKKQWKSVTGLLQPRRALMAASNEEFIYVLGGISDADAALTSVEFTTRLANGDLSQWQNTTPLPQARIYASAVAVGEYLYVMGGGTGLTGGTNLPTAKVIRAKILNDGQLDSWQITQPLSSARRGLKAFAYKNRLYAIGGYDGRFLKSTEFTTISSHDTLRPWREARYRAHLERYIHAAALFGDTFYVLGGHQQQSEKMTAGDVESSRINNDGTLNQWFIEKSRMKTPRFIASAFAHNNFLYIMGGHNGGIRLKSVEFAPIYADGHIGQFEFTSPLKIERSACAVAVAGDYIYVIGGMSNRGTLKNVEKSQVLYNGHLGQQE